MLSKAGHRKKTSVEVEMNALYEDEPKSHSFVERIKDIVNSKWQWWWAVIGCI